MAVRLLRRWLAALCWLAPAVTGAAAEEFRTPSISAIRVEWRAVLDQLRTEIASRQSIASRFTFAGQRRVPAWDPRSTPALVQLNAINAGLFTGIGSSHDLGGTRMADDPAAGVVDRNLAVHDTPGLFVFSGSAMPTCPGINPTLTLWAMVYRAAEALIEARGGTMSG